MIYCVWYPSGGFGHFVNAVLTLHGNNFLRPDGSLEFSSTGDSHSLDLIVPKYFHDRWPGGINFLDDKNYCVLIDNGINNEGQKFLDTFPAAKIIKLCYTDCSWPVVAQTMITKAMKSSIKDQLDFSSWQTDEDWAKREKYFLFLRNHKLRYSWRADNNATNINIKTLLDYKSFKTELINSGVILSNFRKIWNQWAHHNFKYFLPILCAQDIIKQIKNKESVDLTIITDIWTQAVVYYYIWLEFSIEVPHNDYSNWITNTEEIAIMLNNLGVTV